VEKIVEHEEINKFVKWVAKQNPAFYHGNRTSKRKKEIKVT
jgi:hypothetical protein